MGARLGNDVRHHGNGTVAARSTRSLDCMSKRILALSVIPIMLGGCIALPIPHERRVSPLFEGRVTDAATGLPVAGATVTVTPQSTRPNSIVTTASVVTDAAGNFSVAATEDASWYFVIAGPAEGVCGGALEVTHPGYERWADRAQAFRGAAVDGTCSGFVVTRNISLRGK